MKECCFIRMGLWAIILCISTLAHAGGDAVQTPSGERAISFEGQGGDIARILDESGGSGFVVLLGVAAVLLFALLVMAGRKSEENRKRLENVQAAVSQNRIR